MLYIWLSAFPSPQRASVAENRSPIRFDLSVGKIMDVKATGNSVGGTGGKKPPKGWAPKSEHQLS